MQIVRVVAGWDYRGLVSHKSEVKVNSSSEGIELTVIDPDSNVVHKVELSHDDLTKIDGARSGS